MSLYPKNGVYKILLEISGLKKSVVICDLSLKPMSSNPKFTVLEYTIENASYFRSQHVWDLGPKSLTSGGLGGPKH